MHGISSLALRHLWNGKKFDPFLPKKGLRQGDPFSPYLFVLYVERLGYMIQDVMENGNWEPIFYL